MTSRRKNEVSVLAGAGDGGLAWEVLVEDEGNDLLSVLVERTLQGRTATSGFSGSRNIAGQEVNHWIGKTDGTPKFVLAHTSPDVTAVVAIGASGRQYPLVVSAVVAAFSSRFGATPVPDDDEIVEIRVSPPGAGTSVPVDTLQADFKNNSQHISEFGWTGT